MFNFLVLWSVSLGQEGLPRVGFLSIDQHPGGNFRSPERGCLGLRLVRLLTAPCSGLHLEEFSQQNIGVGFLETISRVVWWMPLYGHRRAKRNRSSPPKVGGCDPAGREKLPMDLWQAKLRSRKTHRSRRNLVSRSLPRLGACPRECKLTPFVWRSAQPFWPLKGEPPPLGQPMTVRSSEVPLLCCSQQLFLLAQSRPFDLSMIPKGSPCISRSFGQASF